MHCGKTVHNVIKCIPKVSQVLGEVCTSNRVEVNIIIMDLQGRFIATLIVGCGILYLLNLFKSYSWVFEIRMQVQNIICV